MRRGDPCGRPRTVNNAFVGADDPVRPVQYASMGCVGAGLHGSKRAHDFRHALFFVILNTSP